MDELFLASGNLFVAHSINLAEVFYDFHRAGGFSRADAALKDPALVGVNEIAAMDRALWQAAGIVKSVHRRVSLADCFAIAVAQRLGGTILTSDRHEFEPMSGKGICDIQFIR